MLLTSKSIFLLLLVFSNVIAVPQSPSTLSTSDDSSSSSSSKTSSTVSLESSASSSIIRTVHPHPISSNKLPGNLHSRTFTLPSPTVSQRPRPRLRPTGTEPPTHVPHRDRDRNLTSGQKPITIVFEVLAGLVSLAIIMTFIRCAYNYKRTPKRDRIAEVLSRHYLQRELEELERNPLTLQRQVSIRDPAPPYFPPPPAYTHILPQPAALAPERPVEYTQLPTSTPPSSPPIHIHPLPPSPVTLSASTDSDATRTTPSASPSESQPTLTPTPLPDVLPPPTFILTIPFPSQPSG